MLGVNVFVYIAALRGPHFRSFVNIINLVFNFVVFS